MMTLATLLPNDYVNCLCCIYLNKAFMFNVEQHLLRILVEVLRGMDEHSLFTQVRASPYVTTNVSMIQYL